MRASVLDSAGFALPLAAALALLPCTAQAGGDSVYGTRGNDQMSEREHTIEMSFERGYATLTVQRTVHNSITRHDEAKFWINLPETAVATGLRSLGELNGRAKWFEAELLEAEAAAATYRELTGLGAYYPKDPALLSWRDSGYLALQVFPVAPGTDKTIDYTVEMPARWEDGRWHLWIPAMGTAERPAELRVNPQNPLDQLFANGEVVPRGHYERLDDGLELALAPRDPAPINLSLASVNTGSRSLVHWRVTVAPELAAMPHDAAIVVALDLSKSAADQLEAQRSAALAYLAHFGDAALGAEVAIIGYDRQIRAITAGFVSASEALAQLEAATLEAHNGSEIGLALTEVEALLAGDRSNRPERVVVFGDFETATRVTPESVAKTTSFGDAIVHLVDVQGTGWPSLQREDSHDWAALAATTGGVAWTAAAPERSLDPSDPSDPNDQQQAQAVIVFEELGRPMRIDRFRSEIPGLVSVGGDQIMDFDGAALDEGQGIEGLALSTTAATALAVDGLLWNMPVHQTTTPSRATGDRWAALVFGNAGLYPMMSEDEMMVLAMRGGAVSPVTSYLAIEPGVRPSTEGLEEFEGVGFGSGGFGSGIGVSSHSFFGHHTPSFDKQAWLETELGDGWTRCGGAAGTAELALETMTTELIDAELRVSPGDAKVNACMDQVTWSVNLPGQFSGRERWTIKL